MRSTFHSDERTYHMDVEDAVLIRNGEFSGNLDLEVTFSDDILLDQVLKNFRIRIGPDSGLADVVSGDKKGKTFSLGFDTELGNYTGMGGVEEPISRTDAPKKIEVFWLAHSEDAALGEIPVILKTDDYVEKNTADHTSKYQPQLQPSSPTRSSERKPHFMAKPAFALIAIVLFAGGLYFSELTTRSVKRGLESLDWIEIEGLLLNAKLPVEYSGNNDNRSEKKWFELSYAYSTTGQKSEIQHHFGYALDVMTTPKSSPNFLGMNTTITRIRESAPSIKVYYDPSDPQRSVIWKGVPYRSAAYAVLASVLLCSSILPLISSFKTGANNQQSTSSGSTVFLAIISYGLLGGAYTVLVYTLFPLLQPYCSLLFLTLFFPVLCVTTLIIPLLGRSKALSPLKSILHAAATLVVLAVFGLSLFSFVRDTFFVHNEALEDYQLTPEQLSEALNSKNTKLLSWASYRLAGLDKPVDAAKKTLLKHVASPDMQVRKASLFALSKYNTFNGQELAQVFAQLPDEDDKITRDKVLFLKKHKHYPVEEVLSLTKPMLKGTEPQRYAALRYLGGLKNAASPLSGEILDSIQELEPGPTTSIGLHALGSLDKPTDGITPLLLKILNFDNPGSQISALNYLEHFPELLGAQETALHKKICEIERTGNDQWRKLVKKIPHTCK